MRIQTYTEEWGSSVFRNALAGLTSSFALVPECIAFALVAHLNPLMGLYGAFIICALTAILGGRPGMISGAAGSMAVVIVALVVEHGVQYLLATVVLAGALMMIFGLLRLGKLIRMVPHPVMIGFVNGLAIIIALAQLEQFKRATPQGNVWLQGMPLLVMCGLVALTIVVVYAVPRVTKAAPPALVAIIGIGLLSQFAGLNTRTLGDMAHIAGGFPSFRLPLVPLDLGTLKIVFPYAVLTAIVGLLETLLTFNLTEEMTGTLGRPNRECIALGIANVVSGCFGGMGGCAMIGQTVINLSSGGRSRVSGTTSGIMILLFILFLSPLIERIPLAALVGVMLVVAQQTFSWGSLRLWGKVPRGDALVVLSVTLITIFTDLAIAVLFGVIISALHFSWKHARSIRAETFDQREGERTYVLYGTLFFASTANFQDIFKPQSDPQTVIVDCKQLKVVDHSAIAAFEALKARYQKAGRRLQFVHLSPHCQHILRRAGVAIMADAN